MLLNETGIYCCKTNKAGSSAVDFANHRKNTEVTAMPFF